MDFMAAKLTMRYVRVWLLKAGSVANIPDQSGLVHVHSRFAVVSRIVLALFSQKQRFE